MTCLLKHETLQATLLGVEDDRYGAKVTAYRNIKYGTIAERFSKPKPIESFGSGRIDCSSYGPQCPQMTIGVEELLRIPKEFVSDPPREDEFECLNLNVTLPGILQPSKLLPVIVWIHGGSQIITFPSAASRCGDPTRFVAESIKAQGDVIFVTFNYRLNIFGFGDGTGERNLALQDQRLLIAWVRKHIGGFGGDTSRITLAGESAGAVYVHAHLVSDPTIDSAILASGSLYLSPPLPEEFGKPLLQKLADVVQRSSQNTLATAPASALISALETLGVSSMWLQDEPSFASWQARAACTPNLMVGDVEYEGVIWRNGIENATTVSIAQAFDTEEGLGTALRKHYGISPERSTSSRTGALDFLGDARFGLPAEDLWQKARENGHKRVFRYLFDENNPWHYSSRAHHAVDLLFLFGGIDLAHNPLADDVGKVWRAKWIEFANGQDPWESKSRFAFGPHGRCGVLSETEYEYRRRERCFKIMRQMTWSGYNPIFRNLANGRISLRN